MGKSSSSSLKKKRSKISSSQARIKKRSKSRTKRSSKLKKLRHRDDSLSHSSDSDDSRNSISVSSSASEDDKRSRRPRSRTRKDVKGRKKRARRSSPSYETSEDSRHVKRRRGSGRSEDSQVRKKTERKRKKKKKKKKKLSKREVSVSSTSSGSWSCSTCRDDSGSDDSEVEKNRGRTERKDKDRRFEKVKSGSGRRRSRSRSCSSCSHYSDYGNEEFTGDVNFRRLRSVIVAAGEDSEGREMDKDEHKEEMEYDHDDYPPSRSNDSNDGGSKRELVHSSHFTSEEKRNAEGERGEEAVVSNIRTGQVTESDKESEGYDGSNPGCDGVFVNDAVKKDKTDNSGAVDGPNVYDLESKLRQKALENLRSFRKGHQTDAKAPVSKKDLIDGNVKTVSATKAKLFQNKSPKGGGARVVSMGQVADRNIIPVESKVSTEFSQNDGKISDRNDSGKESGAEHDIAHRSDHMALAGSPSERVNLTFSSELNKPRSIVLASRRESPNSGTSKKQIPALLEPSQSKSMTGNSVVESVVEDVQTVILVSSKSNGEEVNKAHGSTSDDSCPKSISGGTGSNKLKDEAKEDSQFEQKTMTVMRGGEMVEVSYKVYIPKKAPALSRRPLKR